MRGWQHRRMSAADVVRPKPSVIRGIIAALFALACVVYIVVSVFGVWNPRHYVILLTYFNNPVGDASVVLFLALVAFWCGFPIRSTAVDRRLSLARTTLIILILLSLFGLVFTFAFGVWRYRPSPIATSPRGDRQVVSVGLMHGIDVHIVAGSGLSRRDVGSLGTACGLPSDLDAVWVSDDEVKITTVFKTYDVRLNPRTGVPLLHFGATCTS
jgi:hypothetical protein